MADVFGAAMGKLPGARHGSLGVKFVRNVWPRSTKACRRTRELTLPRSAARRCLGGRRLGSVPELPGGFVVFPEGLEQLLVAQRVHALPEPGVAKRLQLAVLGEIFERLAFPLRVVVFDVVEDAR